MDMGRKIWDLVSLFIDVGVLIYYLIIFWLFYYCVLVWKVMVMLIKIIFSIFIVEMIN